MAVKFPEDVPVLTDGVVTLRAHAAADVDGVLEQCLDPLSRRWTGVPLDYTRDDAVGFVGGRAPAAWAESTSGCSPSRPATTTARPRFCGTVELRDEGAGRAEIAYGAHPWARGRGVVPPGADAAAGLGLQQAPAEHGDLVGQPRQLGVPAGRVAAGVQHGTGPWRSGCRSAAS